MPIENMSKIEAYYFGCLYAPGHHMYDTDLCDAAAVTPQNPWGTKIDGYLCPAERTPGKILAHHKNGWTVLTFWDDSIDKRPGANSAFLAKGIFSYEEILEIARQKFPSIMQRFAFPLQRLSDLPPIKWPGTKVTEPDKNPAKNRAPDETQPAR